jgi:ATP-dependent Clp protease ATP-binding subunit ClpA
VRYHVLTAELLSQAGQKARLLGHSCVGTAHFLMVLSVQSWGIGQFLRNMGLNPELTEDIAQLFYGVGTPQLPLPQGFTEDAKRMLQQAAQEARQQHCREIRQVHILLAMSRQEESTAAEILRFNGIAPEMLYELQQKLNCSTDDSQTSGLTNVHRRLKLFFGGAGGVELAASDLGGLKVILKIGETET